MNYLAHIFLSFNNADVLVGNFIGDMIRPKEMKLLEDGMKRGIKLHRKIDAFTDSHFLIKEAIGLVKPSQGKYSPVVIDIYGDYFLSKFWSEFTAQDFNTFKERSYHDILKYTDSIPKRIQPRVQSMVKHDWLSHYGNKKYLNEVFKRVSYKAKFDNSFLSATEDLSNNEEELSRIFKEFLPELIAFSKKELEY